MSWADAVRGEYNDYWNTIKRMEEEIKSDKYKKLKKYALQTKKGREEWQKKSSI